VGGGMNPDFSFDYESLADAEKKARQAIHDFVDEGYRTGQAQEPTNPAFEAKHQELSKTWGKALVAAYPPGFWESFAQLQNRDLVGLPIAIEFLEADPWFFRSGYYKEKLIRYILRLDLTTNFQARLRKIILAAVDKRYRREFREYCRLARKVDNSELREALLERLKHDNSDIRRRAQWVLDGLEKGVPRIGKLREAKIRSNQKSSSPRVLENVIEGLQSGNSNLFDEIMLVLEWYGMFGQRGRFKGKLIEALTHTGFPESFKPFLRTTILLVVDTWYVYGFDGYCKLAAHLDDPEFRQELNTRLDHSDPHVKRRARLVLEAMK
jgi:hypothetical protein